MTLPPTPATAALARVVGRKAGGQARPGQQAMCQAVEEALGGAGHLLVEAPTGTGKSLAYLVPAVLFATGAGAEHRRVVVVTATKALQEQLVGEDLPFLAAALAEDGVRFAFTMLKGRSNYLCRAKLAVSLTDGVEARLDFGPGGPQAAIEAVAGLAAWAEETPTGDRADFPAGITDAVWSQVSVDPGECPGAAKCSEGGRCFAEAARERAGSVEVLVVNAHLYATHLAAGGGVLPEHDAAVFDEAHTLESIVSSVFGVRLWGGRVRRLAFQLRGAGGGADLAGRLERAATALDDALDGSEGDGPPGRSDQVRVRPAEGDLAAVLNATAALAAEASAALRRLGHLGDGDDVTRSKVASAVRVADGLRDDVARLLDPSVYDNHVAWIEPGRRRRELHLAAVDVAPLLSDRLFGTVTVVATSATLATAGRFDLLARRLGVGARHRSLAVASPFDHRRQGLLYVPVRLPDPRHPDFAAAVHEELHTLITAAGGRTLALFTSRSAMERAAAALAGRGGYEILVQDRLPRAELLARFRAGPGTAVFATQSFWSGIDLPGSLCHLVTIDKIPFPRPTDPLASARREAAAARGENAFATVDLPAAATLLAQGAGRLIRSTTDEGVVAVFDRRLAVAGYRGTLLDTLPRFTRTIERDRVIDTLTRLASTATAAV